MRLKRPSVHVARAIDRALSGEMVKTLRPAARGDGDGAPRHVKHAHKAKKPDALVLAFQQALLRNPAPGAFHPPPARCGVPRTLRTPRHRRDVLSCRRVFGVERHRRDAPPSTHRSQRRRSRPRPRLAGTAAARRCSWCARRPSPTPTRRASRPSRPKDRSASASAKPRTPS